MDSTINKKVFKEKKTVKDELLKALENGIKVNYSMIAKSVGISVHRVKKYCKNHNIVIDNYNQETLKIKKIKKDFDETMKKQKKKKVQIDVNNSKISIGEPNSIKVKIDDKE